MATNEGGLHQQLDDADGWDQFRRIIGHRCQAVADKETKQAEHVQSPVISMAESGSSGVTRASACGMAAAGEPESEPDQQQQWAENAIALEQDGDAREEQRRGDAEEEIEPDQGGAIALGPVGPVGETERAQQCGRGRDQELDPVGHGFPYQSSDEVGSTAASRGAPRRGVTGVYVRRASGQTGQSDSGRERVVW